MIDIYENGQVSEPYEAKVWSSSIWRTSRWLTGYSNNRDDIPKIQKLMQRALTGYLRGDESLKEVMISAIKGMENLEIYYHTKGLDKTEKQIHKIIDYANKNLMQSSPEHSKKLENFSELSSLESSTKKPWMSLD